MQYRKKVQIVFQNPFAALNPRQRVVQMLKEVLKIHGNNNSGNFNDEIMQILKSVGMGEEALHKYPFEFSGGQRQRLCIARALAVNPELIVCDEPVSALDVSVKSQILNLLKKLQAEFNLTYLLISHDLSIIYHMCDYIYIMYLGKIVEQGEAEAIFANPKHPYTKALIDAIPLPDPELKKDNPPLSGEIPNPTILPPGCFLNHVVRKK